MRTDFQRGDLPKALAEAKTARESYQKSSPDWASAFQNLQAEVLIWQGKPKDSLALLAEAPSRSISSPIAAKRKLLIGVANAYLRKFVEADEAFAEASALAAPNDSELIGQLTLAKATLASIQDDNAKAGEGYRQALRIARERNLLFLEANALGNLGFTEMAQQHFDAAVDWFEQSLAVSRKLGNPTQESKTLGNLGWCYFKMGDFERAAEMSVQSEKSAGQLGLANDQFIWLTNIGSIYYQRRDYAQAANYYQKALDIARRLDNKSGAAVCLNNMSATALETQQYDQAEKYNREALEIKRAIGDKPAELYSLLNEARIAEGRKHYDEATKLLKEVVANSGEDVSLRWEAESELADLYAVQGNIAAAGAQFRQALATIDKARASLQKEEHRLSFMGSAERFYNDYIDFLVSSGRTKEALEVAEHSRARTLAEGLKIPVAGVLEAGFSPEQTAKKLNSVILSYWLKPEQSYLWAVTPSRVELFKLPAVAEIDAEAQAYRKALMGPRDVKETENSSGAKLHEMLVAPAQKLIAPGARVVVIGGGAINTLNFETLLAPKPQVHYWIEDAVVTNASSIALLSGAGRAKNAAEKKLLLIGDPVYAGSEFPELKQAKLEIKDVAEHFSPSERRVLEGAAATPAAYVANNVDGFAYLHFVAHGTASRTSPLDSSIILSRQSDVYKLYARDIMKQPLKAELVTISACYGAGNRSYSGEGLVGLSWAFLRAGAQNVIAALWEVSDTSTPELMDAMYGRLKQGQDPATALREAKLKMLRSDSVYRRPFYWGAFQVYSGWGGSTGVEKKFTASTKH